MTPHKILIVEDEESIVHALSSILTANDYAVLVANTGEQALALAASHQPDVVLLDLGLPGMDGIAVLRELRGWYGRPVLVVSARDQEREKVEALDLGADDYITKPFGTSELLARIRAALRNSGRRMGAQGTGGSFTVGALSIDFLKRAVSLRGEGVHLTQIEYRIVELLARNAGSVLTYDEIMREVWGPYVTDSNTILRVNMANIRRKLEDNPADPSYFLTETGIGYRMADGSAL